MEYSFLGKSDLNISKIGFGCMSLKPSQSDVQWLIDEAIDNGINYFDTADLYDKGLNESMIGQALKHHRSKIIIATKGGNEWKKDGSGWDWNPTKEYLINAAEQSLQRLQIDYIDLYQLHGGTIEDNMDETIEAFEILKQQGKIRYYGISSIRPNVILEYMKHSNIVSVMTQYSLLDRRPEETTLPLLLQNKIGVLARGTVAGGLLAGKQAKSYLNYSIDQVTKAASAIRNISEAASNGSEASIRYVISNPAITAAVVGIRTGDQLNDAVRASTKGSLRENEIQQLRISIPANYYEQHR